ncbi:hypothetical protein [Pajaroellobacter abortibovis]|nr:hypothetical protein [Pajaroellobacter abortibovis]
MRYWTANCNFALSYIATGLGGCGGETAATQESIVSMTAPQVANFFHNN